MQFIKNLYAKFACRFNQPVQEEKKRTDQVRTSYLEIQIQSLERDTGRIQEHLEDNPWGIETLAEFSSPSPYRDGSVRRNMHRDHAIAHGHILTNLKHYRKSVDSEIVHAYFSTWKSFDDAYNTLEEKFLDSDRQL